MAELWSELYGIKGSKYTKDTVDFLKQSGHKFFEFEPSLKELPQLSPTSTASFKQTDYKSLLSNEAKAFIPSTKPVDTSFSSSFLNTYKKVGTEMTEYSTALPRGLAVSTAKLLRNTIARVEEMWTQPINIATEMPNVVKAKGIKGAFNVENYSEAVQDTVGEKTKSFQALKKLTDALEGKIGLKDDDNLAKQLLYSAGGSLPTMALTATGAGIPLILNDAYMNSVESLKAGGYNTKDKTVQARALLTAMFEVGSEYAFGAFAKVGKSVGLSWVKAGINKIDDGAKVLFKNFLRTEAMPTAAKNFAFLMKQGAEEGFEEILSTIGAGVAAKWTTNPNDKLFTWNKEDGGLVTAGELGMSFVAGGLMGFMFSTFNNMDSFQSSKRVMDNLKDKPYQDYSEEDYSAIGNAFMSDMDSEATQTEVAQVMVEKTVEAEMAQSDLNAFKTNTNTVNVTKTINDEMAQTVRQEPVVTQSATTPITTQEFEAKVRNKTYTDTDIEAFVQSNDAKTIREKATSIDTAVSEINRLTEELAGARDESGVMKINLQLLAYKNIADKLKAKMDKGAPQYKAFSEHITHLIEMIDTVSAGDVNARNELRDMIESDTLYHKVLTEETARTTAQRKMGLSGKKPNKKLYESHKMELVQKFSDPRYLPTPDEEVAFAEYLNDAMREFKNTGVMREDAKVMLNLASQKATSMGRGLGALSYIVNKMPYRQAEKLIETFDSELFNTPKTKEGKQKVDDFIDDVNDIREGAFLEEVESMTYQSIEAGQTEPVGEPKSMSEKLADMIVKDFNKKDATPKEQDMAKKVLRELYTRYSESIIGKGNAKPKPTDAELFRFIGDLAIQSEDLTSVWGEAKDLVDMVVSEEGVKPDSLLRYFQIINPLYSNKLLDKAVLATLRSLDIDVKDMARQHFFRNENAIDMFNNQLRKDIEKSTGKDMSDAEFKYLTSMTTERLLKKLYEKRALMYESLKRRMTGVTKDGKQVSYQEQMVKKIMDMVMLRQFDNEAVINEFLTHLNVPFLSQQMKDKIYSTMEKISEMQSNKVDQQDINNEYENLLNEISSMVPASPLDKYKSWRYMAMLGNPATVFRNASANIMAIPHYGAMDAVQRKIDKLVGVPESERDLYKHRIDLKSSDPVAVQARTIRTDEINQFLLRSDKYATLTRIQSKKRIYSNQALETFRTTIRDTMSGTIQNKFLRNLGDAPVYDHHFRIGFANKLKQLGYTESLSDGDKQMMRAKAMESASIVAEERTFRRLNTMSKNLMAIKKSHPSANALIAIMEPFIITKSAIALEIFKFSPASLAVEVGRMVSIGVNEKRLGEKNIEQRKKLSKNLSQALVGTTGQIAVGIILGSLGFLTGAEPEDDKEKEAWRMLGKQAYSIYIPNVGSFSIDWMQPIAAGLTVGAQISQTGGDVSKISEAMLESMFQNSVAESLSRLFGYRTWTDRVQYLGSNAVLQHFPSITRSIANAIDPYERDIYQGTALQILANRMLTAIPGASYLVPPKVDVWGNPISKSDMGYGFAGRMLQVLAPFRMRTENMDSTSKNVIDLFEETGKVEVLPRIYSDTLTVKGVKYEMNGDQYAEFQQLAGSEAKRLVDQVTSNPEFKDMTPEMKAKILDKMYDRAGKTARTTIFNRYFAK